MVDYTTLSDDELSAKISELQGSNSTSVQNTPLYDEEPMEDESDSLLDTIYSKAGAFSAGFEAIDDKLLYNLDTTAAAIAESLGFAKKGYFEQRRNKAQARLDKAFTDSRFAEDVRKNPGTAYLTRDLGSLGVEIGATIATGGALAATKTAGAVLNTGAKKVLAGAAGDALAGGTLAALESTTDKGAAFKQGAILGGAIGGTLRTGGAVLSKALSSGKSADEVASTVNANQQLSKQTGIPLSIGQETGSAALQGLEQAARNVPMLGTNKFFNHQYETTTKAIDSALNKVGVSLKQLSKKGVSQDVGSKTATRISDAFNKRTAASDKLYDVAVKDSKLISSPTRAAEKAMDLEAKFANLQSLPSGIKNNLINVLKDIENIAFQPTRAKDVLALRKTLDKHMGTVYANSAHLPDEVIGGLKGLRNTLENDLHHILKQDGKYQQYVNAKRYWKSNVKPFQEIGFDGTKGTAGIKPILKIMQDPAQKGAAVDLLKAIGPEGQNAIRQQFALEAGSKAVDNLGNLNVNRFVSEYKSMLKTSNIPMGKEHTQAINGITKLIRTVDGMTPSTLGNVRTGIAGATGVGGLVYAPGLAISSALLVKTGSLLLTSEAGKRLIYGLAKLPVGSKRSQEIANNVLQIANGVKNGTLGNAMSRGEPTKAPINQNNVPERGMK